MILFTPLQSDWEGTEWRRWEAGVYQVPRPHLSYLPMEGGGRSDKGQGFGCDKQESYVLLWSWRVPWPSTVGGHPKARCWPQAESVCAPLDMLNAVVCLYQAALLWRMTGRKCDTDGERGSGGVQGRILPADLMLQESQIASGSIAGIHPRIAECF